MSHRASRSRTPQLRRRTAAIAAALALGWLAAGSGRAHDTWLLPAQSTAAPGKPLALAMTSGMAFPQEETAIAATRVARSGARLGGGEGPLASKDGDSALAFTAELGQAGIATLFVELHPRTLDLTPEDVTHYLEEIGAPAAVVARWQATPEPRRWRESYRKNVKTFVRVGEPGEDRSWERPVGSPLELVPAQDPTALHAGDRLAVRLLRDGAPAAGVTVGLVRAGDPAGTNLLTGADGSATFALEREGWYLLRATDLRPASGKDLDWESDFATLTLEVKSAAPAHGHGSR